MSLPYYVTPSNVIATLSGSEYDKASGDRIIQRMAENTRSFYENLKKAGFSHDDAFDLTKATLSGESGSKRSA